MKKISILLFGYMFVCAIYVQAQFSIPKVLLEVHSGCWTGYGPDAAVKLDDILENNSNVFAINIHYDDAMAFAEGEEVTDFYTFTFPVGTINRHGKVYRGDWQDSVSNALTQASIVTVSFDSVKYNLVNGMLDVYVMATFTGTATGDFRFNCVLIEDHVISVESDYNQNNYYNFEEGHEYYNAGSPIIGFDHRYVARSFMGGAWGVADIITDNVFFGQTFTHHFSTIVPPNYDPNQLSLIAMVSRFDGSNETDRIILNVEKYDLITTPESDFNISENTICKGETITYTNTSTNNATSWFWEFEGGIPATSDLENPGEITYPYGGIFYTKLTASNSIGSNIKSMIVLVDSINTQVEVTSTSIISLEEGANYQWFTCNGSFVELDGETSQEFFFPSQGFYSVEIDNGNCFATSACYYIDNADVELQNLSLVSVFPNPSNGKITIDCMDDCYLTLSDLRGRKLLSFELASGLNEIDLNLDAGIYLLSILSKDGAFTSKLIIE